MTTAESKRGISVRMMAHAGGLPDFLARPLRAGLPAAAIRIAPPLRMSAAARRGACNKAAGFLAA